MFVQYIIYSEVSALPNRAYEDAEGVEMTLAEKTCSNIKLPLLQLSNRRNNTISLSLVMDGQRMLSTAEHTASIYDRAVAKPTKCPLSGAKKITDINDWIKSNGATIQGINTSLNNKVDKVPGKNLSTNDYSNEEKEKLQNANANALFTNNTPTVQAHGGVPVGKTFNNVPVNEVLNMILYPWVAPVVSAQIKVPGNGGVKEFGDIQNVTSIGVTVTKKSSNITKVEIFDGEESLGSKTGGEVTNGGTFTFAVDRQVSANKNYQAKVTDAAEKVTTANTGTFTFVYPYYCGVIDAGAAVNETTVKGLAKQVVTKGNKSNKFTATNQRICFAYPKSYGALTSIKDQNNFDVTGTFNRTEVTITGLDKTPQTYYVYTNSPSTVTGFGMNFNY